MRQAKNLRATTKKFSRHLFQEIQTAVTAFLERIAEAAIDRSRTFSSLRCSEIIRFYDLHCCLLPEWIRLNVANEVHVSQIPISVFSQVEEANRGIGKAL
ncbi:MULTISPECIES: DUF1661 domain-containing protein [Porphyromonas]|uniref:DUF1661 domain-containing protein n=1 Tax=Porphyromonas TaxID=836 RepID=UPI001F430ED3|nr:MULTISPECIES: DUF1661 domain-containing protein [Porphyromonas]